MLLIKRWQEKRKQEKIDRFRELFFHQGTRYNWHEHEQADLKTGYIGSSKLTAITDDYITIDCYDAIPTLGRTYHGEIIYKKKFIISFTIEKGDPLFTKIKDGLAYNKKSAAKSFLENHLRELNYLKKRLNETNDEIKRLTEIYEEEKKNTQSFANPLVQNLSKSEGYALNFQK